MDRVEAVCGLEHLFLYCLSFPLRNMAKRSRPSLFIHNAGSRYSRGTAPGCGRLKRVEKSNMRCPALSDGLPAEEAQIRSHW